MIPFRLAAGGFVKFCARDNGRKTRLKHEQGVTEIHKSEKCCILLVLFWKYHRRGVLITAWTYVYYVLIPSICTLQNIPLTMYINIFIPFLLLFRGSCFLKFCTFRFCLSKALYNPLSLLEQHDWKYDNAKYHGQCKSHMALPILEKISSGTELISEQCLLVLCCYCTHFILHNKKA